MTKKPRKGVHVTGRKGAYKIQPWIEHPAFCGCDRCSALPMAERGFPHSIRIKRASIYPDDFAESAKYAREVKRDEERRLSEASSWMAAAPDEITVAQIAAAYIEAHPRSVRDHLIIKAHLIPFFGAMPAASLKAADVRRYQRQRVAEGASPETADREWNTLRAVLNFAEAEERIYRNPVRRGAIARMGEGAPRREFFEPEEWRAFLAVFEDETGFQRLLAARRETGPVRIVDGKNFGSGKRRPDSEASRLQFVRLRELRPFFRALLYGCARLGEIADLRWRDVDLQRNLVTVYQQKTRKPKTIPIAAPWREELSGRQRGLPDAYVYVRSSGRTIGNQEAQRAFALALEMAGVGKPMTPHTIRHTALSWLATAGVSEAHRNEIAGHARTKVGDGYAHLTRGSLSPALAILARIEAEGFTAEERSAERSHKRSHKRTRSA